MGRIRNLIGKTVWLRSDSLPSFWFYSTLVPPVSGQSRSQRCVSLSCSKTR